MVGKQLGNVNWPIYPAIISVYLFICGFAIGPGSIPWFIVAEMFSQENRDAAVSVAITVNWLCNIAVGLGFIQMILYLDIYSFLPSACILFVVIIILFIYLPETMGRSASSVENDFRHRFRGRRNLVDDQVTADSSTSVTEVVTGYAQSPAGSTRKTENK
ncbi:hypothetical protein P879_01555 [Paragonimus westermani]|uniref:Major facilitator superfamily (MFS) profile domain-containing protein n=1 Tax=Paragonimus westermani TaxID=34504 RepID=A0A8T0DM10_9TREM|nr:hypothetical protein P879_01555 [Paragonimus westermani]